MKCTSALPHCTSFTNGPPIAVALLPNSSAVEPESATEQAETCGTYSVTRLSATPKSKNLIFVVDILKNYIKLFIKLCFS